MRSLASLALLVLTGALTGCAAPGESTPRGTGVAAGRAGAPCFLDRHAGQPGTSATASGTSRAGKDGNDDACAGRGGRAATVAPAPKVAGAGSVAVGAGGAGAGGAAFHPLSRVRGASAVALAPGTGLAPSSVSDDDAPVITTVPNPFRAGAVVPGQAHATPRPMDRTTL